MAHLLSVYPAGPQGLCLLMLCPFVGSGTWIQAVLPSAPWTLRACLPPTAQPDIWGEGRPQD